jgi:hypothetical protein
MSESDLDAVRRRFVRPSVQLEKRRGECKNVLLPLLLLDLPVIVSHHVLRHHTFFQELLDIQNLCVACELKAKLFGEGELGGCAGRDVEGARIEEDCIWREVSEEELI